jgi:hypothetical protein
VRRVLLDENLPRLLKEDLTGFDGLSVAEAGWAGTKNGALLRLAAAGFDVFLTADRNLPHQHALSALPLGVVLLAIGSTKLHDLRAAATSIRQAVTAVRPGQLITVGPA